MQLIVIAGRLRWFAGSQSEQLLPGAVAVQITRPRRAEARRLAFGLSLDKEHFQSLLLHAALISVI
jgi:hypothetical protein